MAQDRKRFIVRTKLDGTDLFVSAFVTHISEDSFFLHPIIGGQPTKNFGNATLTEKIGEALRLTENKAKAAMKRAEKAYADIECTTEKGGHLHFEVVELQNTGRR